jgi:hypothetical protein
MISNSEYIEKSEPTINGLVMKQDSAKSIEVIEDPEQKILLSETVIIGG